MKAGKTDFDCNTRVKITHIAGNDPEDKVLVGITGAITHPFPGLMIGSPDKYIAGIWIDMHQRKKYGEHVNLCVGDKVELADEWWETWVFTTEELVNTPYDSRRNDLLVAEDYGSIRQVATGGILVDRTGRATNRYANGSLGVTREDADNIDKESISLDGNPAEQWRLVLCTPEGDFIRLSDDPH